MIININRDKFKNLIKLYQINSYKDFLLVKDFQDFKNATWEDLKPLIELPNQTSSNLKPILFELNEQFYKVVNLAYDLKIKTKEEFYQYDFLSIYRWENINPFLSHLYEIENNYENENNKKLH